MAKDEDGQYIVTGDERLTSDDERAMDLGDDEQENY